VPGRIIEYSDLQGHVVAKQQWKETPERPKGPKVGDTVELVHRRWKVVDYPVAGDEGRATVVPAD
jgi:hypothetical protein